MVDRFPSPKLASAGVTLVFVVLLLATLLTLASAASGRAIEPAILVALSPLPFYLFALWTARTASGRIGQGEALRSLISPMLRRIGWSLFLGAIAQVFLVPWLRPGKTLAMYDIGAITVGAVGITLVIVARLVSDAERDRAELDEIL